MMYRRWIGKDYGNAFLKEKTALNKPFEGIVSTTYTVLSRKRAHYGLSAHSPV